MKLKKVIKKKQKNRCIHTSVYNASEEKKGGVRKVVKLTSALQGLGHL